MFIITFTMAHTCSDGDFSIKTPSKQGIPYKEKAPTPKQVINVIFPSSTSGYVTLNCYFLKCRVLI